MGRGWDSHWEKIRVFTRKKMPRLAILRPLIGRGCAIWGNLIRRDFRSDSSVSVKKLPSDLSISLSRLVPWSLYTGLLRAVLRRLIYMIVQLSSSFSVLLSSTGYLLFSWLFVYDGECVLVGGSLHWLSFLLLAC